MTSEWAGESVIFWIYADRIKIENKGQVIEHERVDPKGRSIKYRHYLSELSRKPQALEQVSKSLTRELGGIFESVWNRLEWERGGLEAARLYKHVLRGILDFGEPETAKRMIQAVKKGEDPTLAVRAEEIGLAEEIKTPEIWRSIEIEGSDVRQYDDCLLGAVR